jgi:preprotein translocase subunit Sec61beta
MADDKIRMPSSGAGLTTFHEESSSRVRISPQTVLALTILTIIVVIILNTTMTP